MLDSTLPPTDRELAQNRPSRPRPDVDRLTEVVDGRIGRIWAYGLLDGETADQLGRTVTALRNSGHTRVVLDLQGVEEIDNGAGWRRLRRLEDSIHDTGGRLMLVPAPQRRTW